jgi:two-component system phosphate regulon sensor histidine kinase PhoR
MTAKIFLKLIAAVFCVLIISLVAVDFMASKIAETSYVDTLSRELVGKCRILSLADLTPDKFKAFAKAAGGRLTMIAADGRVLADSENQPERMENHRSRPEVISALQGQVGISRRASPTMAGTQFLYIAVPVESGALRLAVPLRSVDAEVNAIRFQMLGATTLAFLPAILISAFFARYFSAQLGSIIEFAHQLAQGNFSARLARGKASSTDEFRILTARLNDTGEKLQEMFEQLQKEHVELERLERIRKDFVINVSHELRTPLASIQGYSETLLDGALDDPHHNRRFVQIIRQNAERLTRLTADLLTLSRVELKSQRFNFASYYVNTLLDNARDSMKPMADKQSIRLEMSYAADTAEVFCDSEAMHQILTNLIDNALKYTAAGGTITIGAKAAMAGEHEAMEVWVADTGVGIPSEDLPRLFERFYRVDKARSRELGGTGLGLAIVKHLTRAMGGDVRVESILEKGSTFYFTVPVHDLGLSPDEAIQPQLTAS